MKIGRQDAASLVFGQSAPGPFLEQKPADQLAQHIVGGVGSALSMHDSVADLRKPTQSFLTISANDLNQADLNAYNLMRRFGVSPRYQSFPTFRPSVAQCVRLAVFLCIRHDPYALCDDN